MKKYIFALFVVLASSVATTAMAQNVQLHYDHGRGVATSTVEMFRPDSGGGAFVQLRRQGLPGLPNRCFEICFLMG